MGDLSLARVEVWALRGSLWLFSAYSRLAESEIDNAPQFILNSVRLG
jgi:hypothetical protein